MKYRKIEKKIKYESETVLEGIKLPCYILEDGEKVILKEEVRKVLQEVINSLEELATTAKTKKEFLKLMREKYLDMEDLETKKADLDKLLKACINTPPITLKELVKEERERRKNVWVKLDKRN